MSVGSNVLSVGSPARKKLDQVRAQRAEVEEALEDLEDGASPITAEEATDRALAAWRLRAERARHQMSAFRGRKPSAVDDSISFHDALLDEGSVRKQLLAMFKADGRGDGLSITDQRAQLTRLKAKQAELIEQEYRLTWELLEQGYFIEHIVQVSPEMLLRVAEGLT